MSAKEVHRQPRASGWTEAEHPAWPRGTGCAPRAVRSAAEQGTPGTAQALAGPCAAHRALPPALPLPAGQGLRTPQSSARSSPSHSLPWPPLPAPSPRPSSASHPGWQGRTQRCCPVFSHAAGFPEYPAHAGTGVPARDPLRLTGWHSVCPPGAHSLGDTQTRQTQPAARRAPRPRGVRPREQGGCQLTGNVLQGGPARPGPGQGESCFFGGDEGRPRPPSALHAHDMSLPDLA